MGDIIEIDSFDELGHEKTWIKGTPEYKMEEQPLTNLAATCHLDENASQYLKPSFEREEKCEARSFSLT